MEHMVVVKVLKKTRRACYLLLANADLIWSVGLWVPKEQIPGGKAPRSGSPLVIPGSEISMKPQSMYKLALKTTERCFSDDGSRWYDLGGNIRPTREVDDAMMPDGHKLRKEKDVLFWDN